MRCPSCGEAGFDPGESCPNCRFNGDLDLVIELTHINWVLGEIDAWQTFEAHPATRQQLKNHYAIRQRELEIELGLRLPLFSEQEARQAWPELDRYKALRLKMAEWLEAGLLNPTHSQPIVDEIVQQIDELQARLEGHTRELIEPTDQSALAAITFVSEIVNELGRHDGFATPRAQADILESLAAEKETLETRLGLRPEPEPVQETAVEPKIAKPAETPTLQPEIPPPAPPAPSIPFRDLLWRTLVSERTLRAILFLGIFLLFSAAISFVIWGWRDFGPVVRVAIPCGFTILFFALGRYVRVNMTLHRSGIALSAIAALLIPIDFYTAFVNLDIPADFWPQFWLITSVFCLGTYIVTTLIITSPLFAYLVGVAAGSTVLAGIEVGSQFAMLSRDWYSAGLSLLAAGMILSARGIVRRLGQRWHVFADPFRYLALLAVGVLMPLTFGWRFISREGYDALHYALIVNWWVGGFVLGWGAIYHRSRSLGLLAAISLPVAVYLAQAALFDRLEVNPAWHAFGWACLVPLYFFFGHRWRAHEDDVVRSHGRTATRWGVFLAILTALWSLTDLTSGAAAASSHSILCASVILAALLWQRPNILYAASVLSFTAVSFAMAELGLEPAQLSIGWTSLSLLHILVVRSVSMLLAANQDRLHSDLAQRVVEPLVPAGYLIAALALLPPLFPYDGTLFVYVLGHWIGLAIWGARLAHAQYPGFKPSIVHMPDGDDTSDDKAEDLTGRQRFFPPRDLFQWLAALPMPVWVWTLFDNLDRPLGPDLALSLAALSWGMVALGYYLSRIDVAYRCPWRTVGLVVSVVAFGAALIIVPDGLSPAICLISAGLLYFADAITRRHAFELMPAAWVTAIGYLLFLYRLEWDIEVIGFGLAALVALYFLIGFWVERRRSPVFTHAFLLPLYHAAHALTLVSIALVYAVALVNLAFAEWTDEMRLWGAAAQFVLGIIYGLYAWDTYRERWGHAAAWLGTLGAGFLFTVYSRGRGSSAAKAALLAVVFVLAERLLRWLYRQTRIGRRRRAFFRLAWRLYKRPLLAAGWTVSVGTIGLALIRNLMILDGGWVQKNWAIAGLLIVVGLYALAAWMFRRARFVWFAAILLFAPWTLLSDLGWYTALRPTLPGFAIGWTVLAWVLYLASLLVKRFASRAYALPLRAVAHALVPFSLLWGIADAETSRFAFGFAIGLYGLSAWLDYRDMCAASIVPQKEKSVWRASRFLYPALGLMPVWCVYLLSWLFPAVRHEHYGLMLLAFSPLGLAAGRWWLYRLSGHRYALPAYLTGYVSLIVGTMLVAHDAPLLALTLLYDALLMLISARLFSNPMWAYPAAAMVPISLLIALNQASVAANRHGWWLIGLAAVYLSLAWALRRLKLDAYATSTLSIGFALVALGLPPSSQDQIGALWGYGGAALLYAISASWLRQPLLLTPACALSIVPYAVGLSRSALAPEYYGLALFPGALIALVIGWRLDVRLGRWQDFPWFVPDQWPAAVADRLLGWWALSPYVLGFGLAAFSSLFTASNAWLTALNFLLMALLFGWAIAYFRRRGWLLLAALAAHLSVAYVLHAWGWWSWPSFAWLRFLPVTVITALAAIWIERQREEGPPLATERALEGWSRPLYLLLLVDMLVGQGLCLVKTDAGALVTLVHTLLLSVLAWIWTSQLLPYLGATMGIVTLCQWLIVWNRPLLTVPVSLSQLALGYGVIGYGLALYARWGKRQSMPKQVSIWERPLQRCSVLFSWGIFLFTAILGINLVAWTARAMLGLSFRHIVELERVRMAVGVLSLLGLLYVAASVVYRRLRLGYLAVGMLLAGWTLHAFYVQQWDGLARVQWYAIPAGLYLLGIAYLEWQRGNKLLARWLDYAATLLMLGSLFWQTLLYGWQYALLLGAEGFLSFWWGSARRLRRFFYAGMIGVMLATVGQLINALQSINQWIVFGVIGLLLFSIAAIVERRLEEIRASLQEVLEDWE
ncbi:MAG: hypothetical protein JW934_02030 [Anaerolineae bacterium]|nr:hypothetical protein [Anaerolineae bacterium]